MPPATVHHIGTRRRQSGATLLVFAALLVTLSAGLLIDRLSNRVQVNNQREEATSDALAQAKAALIGWSVSHPDEPGRLPWPDRNGDGNHDGQADCVSQPVPPNPFNDGWLLGRFPHAGDVAPCDAVAFGSVQVDGAGEPLWYAVSRNLLWNRGQALADPQLNPGLLDGAASYPWLTVRDQNGNVISSEVAAVIIAPGRAIGGQARAGAAPNPDQYLDSVTIGSTTHDNSDANLDFIIYPDSRTTPADDDAFNDRLVLITIDELMRPVEKRVLGDAAVALQGYRTTHGRYPWMSPYRPPVNTTAGPTLTGRVDAVNPGGIDKITDNEADFQAPPAVQPGDVIVNVTRRTSWTITNVNGPKKLNISGPPDFQVGDAYNVRPAFNGVWGGIAGLLGDGREGHIPYIDVNVNEWYALATGFTLTWSNGTASPPPDCLPVSFPWWLGLTAGGCSQLQNSYQSGSFTQPQPAVPTPAAANGECIWTTVDDADCFCHTASCDQNFEVRSNAYTVDVVCIGSCGGSTTILNLPVERELTYTFDYTGTGAVTTTNNVKTRQVTNTAPETIHMKDTITVLGIDYVIWEGDVAVPAGSYVMDEIYFDIEDGIEFPGYFFTNGWHEYIYAKIAADHVAINTITGNPSGDNCAPGADCVGMQIGGATVRDEIQGVLVGAGGALGTQNRANGSLSDYFENANAAQANDTAERAVLANSFNDQVRVIRPNPP